jgi:hypothetical protein
MRLLFFSSALKKKLLFDEQHTIRNIPVQKQEVIDLIWFGLQAKEVATSYAGQAKERRKQGKRES